MDTTAITQDLVADKPSQFQLEQQVLNSFKRKSTSHDAEDLITNADTVLTAVDQSRTMNASAADDTYISDLEEAGRLFQLATEMARDGQASEAVPLFLEALREFERLHLPELPQVQDEIGFWLEAMEAQAGSHIMNNSNDASVRRDGLNGKW